MIGRLSLLNASLLLSTVSLGLAAVSMLAGRRVNYLDYLTVFNVMAALMLALGIGAMAMGVVGTWRARGRSVSLWIANALAAALLVLYLFNP